MPFPIIKRIVTVRVGDFIKINPVNVSKKIAVSRIVCGIAYYRIIFGNWIVAMRHRSRVVAGTGGGPEKTILNSPRFLAADGYQMLLAYMRDPTDAGFRLLEERAVTARAELVGIDDYGPLDRRIYGRLAKVCGEFQPDIWHGHDYKSNLFGALLKKRCGFRLGQRDVFLNLAGGIRIEEPAMDLAIIAAILSSSEDIPVDGDICFAGEVGLTGEIRPVTRTDQRISEAQKLGFGKVVIPRHSKGISDKQNIELMLVRDVEELVKGIFG